LIGMIPGIGKQAKDIEVDEKDFDHIQALILSMTPEERAKPELINGSRKRRIAAGSGQKVEDVNKLLNQYKQMQKMFKQMNNKQTRRAMKRMAGSSDLQNLDFSKLGL
ncbi:MAG TPA: signal recognition particle protein, partial [Clostridiales bacterium]|nr:signal recognition particle protein [Clostridiales bacterium]